METVALNIEQRDANGKGAARKLRGKGMVPGVIYGATQAPVSVALSPVELRTLLRQSPKGRNTIIKLNGAGQDYAVLVQEIQVHPVSREMLHVDLLAVDLNKTVRAKVPLKFEGKAEGVKLGGTFDQLRHTIVVEALPADVPASIVVDVTNIQRNQSLHIADVPMPEGVKALYRNNFAVAAVS